jgi:hypothetical protein
LQRFRRQDLQLCRARPFAPREGIDYYGVGNGSTTDFAILLTSSPNNYLATKAYTATQIRSCLADGSCYVSAFDSQRGLAFFQLDTRFSKTVKFREKASLEFIFQFFDLTNRANFGGNYYNNIRSSAYGQPAGFVAPSSVVVPQFFCGEGGFTFRF